jgi:hypothetical protein
MMLLISLITKKVVNVEVVVVIWKQEKGGNVT